MTAPDLVAVVTGPTATGKTRLGVELALALDGEVVGADSMQIYRDMAVGTARPSPEEMRGVPHHMIGFQDPGEDYSVSRYVEDASRCVDDILARGKLPILVGGTGLYIESLLRGRDFAAPPGDPDLRRELDREYDEAGGEEMLRRLAGFDPGAAERLHPNDRKRILRATEVYRLTGKTITKHDEESRRQPPRYRSRRIALTYRDRADLYRRIDRRVEEMYAAGLAEEVKALLDRGVPKGSTALQAIGYKEILRAMEAGETPESAMEEIQRESRRYAKRQLSWLGRDKELFWITWEREPVFSEGLCAAAAFLTGKTP